MTNPGMVDKVKAEFSRITTKRCQNCPAYWSSVDYWGEWEDGCSLYRDHLEFCPLSLLPQAIMKPYVKYKERQEERHWEKVYEEDCKKWEKEGVGHDQ